MVFAIEYGYAGQGAVDGRIRVEKFIPKGRGPGADRDSSYLAPIGAVLDRVLRIFSRRPAAKRLYLSP